ncbi:CUB and sushi domain-containing protein 3 isoform X2 [Cimex lectularius]|uniref:Uncharacterized protein n=1 Tax=Cimex lectularius TaxID=79782 RepID=A0A8I6S6D7_CIMLE|nr:CUB and sushi domain-containing protein 3 isoform X2 [Cimex lectularius]
MKILFWIILISSVLCDDSEDYSGENEDDAKVYKNPRNSPSVECPRDEEHAEFLGQKCLRKCSNDEDCKSKKKKCICDGVCGMSCIKPERECPELRNPDKGTVVVTGKLFGDRATYECEPGHHLVGLKERTCRGDGEWSGVEPQCKHIAVFCKEPPVMEYARHNALPEQTTFPLESVLQYQCVLGYTTNGFPKAKCLAIDKRPSWFGPDISCQPKSCGPPTDPSNGWHSGQCYTYGCRIEYHCIKGYELVGRGERTCQADATWMPRDLPACVLVTAVECPVPENPQYGTAHFTTCQYNAVVSYECRYGYTLVGERTRRCGEDRKWSGTTPKCKAVDCGQPGQLYQGWIENIEGGTALGASVIFRCREGMLLVGNTSAVCQLDGTWTYPVPQCLAPCVIPKVDQGRVIFESNSTLNQIPHGEELNLTCETRYEPNTFDSPLKCNNGSWEIMPKCIPARCKYLPKAPKNGMVIAPKTEHGMKARFSCKDGYTLKGEGTTECRYGNWTGEIPYCQEVYCPFPGYVENGKILLVGNMGLYDYRPYVRKVNNNKQVMYECNKGFTLLEGPPGATCVAGAWSPKQLPKCVPGLHPRLRWSRKKRSLMTLRRLKRRLKRALSGQNTQVLRKPATGSSKPDPQGTGRGRAGGKGSGSGKESGGEGDEEEEEEGDKSTKKEGEKKKKKKPSRKLPPGGPCSLITIENYMKLDILKKGRDNNNTYPHGTLVRLTCATGYSSNLPNGTAKCVRTKWKPAKPLCGVSPCKIPETQHGIFSKGGSSLAVAGQTLNNTSDVPHAEIVDVSCSPGYNLQGSANMKCWHGQWDAPILPTCTPAPCQLPVIPHGQYLLGYRPGLTIGNGSSVRFQCDTEYKASTVAPLTCILGELRPTMPHCKTDPGSMFMAGSDITKAGQMGAIDYVSGLRGSCAPPDRVQGTLVYKNGEPLAEAEKNFPDGTEVTFNCIASIMGEKITWRIICEDGSWLGHSLNCELDDSAKQGSASAPRDNTTCLFTNSEPHVSTFYLDQLLTEDTVEFPSGAELQFRCVDIGKFAMIGSNRRRCNNGQWDGVRPACFGLNQQNDYLLEKPPTILFRHELGPIAQSNDGKLIVFPGTILHMECLWIRRFGTPKWVVSHNYRKYPESWNNESGRDPQLEYRLSILHATKDDSGTFSCITPTRHTHSVEIVVEAVYCQPLPPRRGLMMSTTEVKMNTKVLLSCANGNALIGSQELVCLPSGNWSSPVPVCESMECPDLGNGTDPNLRASILSREVGGQVVFSCSPGFGLVGPVHSTCLLTGEWAGPLPICKEVQCTNPEAPPNGYSTGNPPYKAGDLVQFACNQDYMMEGQPIIACQENGRWSGPVPNCVRACAYPGTVIAGRISSVKFYYQIGETVSFTCDDGLKMTGAGMLRCLKSAKWSAAIPTCS